MKLRILGSSDIKISEVGLGTNYIGGHNLYEKVDENVGMHIIEQALDAGINFVDTADIYGMGRSEELIGKTLGKNRHRVVIATKGGIMFDGKTQTGINNSPRYLRKALEASLKRLNRDYIDLYYIHKPDGLTPPEEAYDALMQFKKEGLIRAAGVSNFELTDLKAALTAGPVDALQSCYNLLQREVESEVLPFCRANQISFIPWGPLAFGLLGGKYPSDFVLPENDWRRRVGLFDGKVFKKNIEMVESLKPLARKKGVPLARLAISWLLSRPEIGSVIAGAKQPAQVVKNALASGCVLTETELAEVEFKFKPFIKEDRE